MPQIRRPAAVALYSAAALSYEVLLMRAFAIEHFHHFAYMAIGVAMLGFGAGGTLLALAGRLPPERADRLFVWSGVAAVAALVVSPLLIDGIALDPTQLAWDLGQWPRLGAVYLSLAVPFGVTALAVLLGITLERNRPGIVYGASFLGSGLGSILALAVLWLMFPTRALAVPAVLAAAGALVGVGVPGRRRIAGAAAWTAAVFAVVGFVRPPWTLDVNPYKGLPQVEAFPDARRVAEHTSPVGWVVAVEAPAQRYAPGLSLLYPGDFPRQTGLFVDGQLAGAVAGVGTEYLDWLPGALPYALPERNTVLVLGAGSGSDVANAVIHGAESVVAVELHPDLARLVHEHGDEVDSDVAWVVGDARSHVARTEERFDVITLGALGGFGAASAGVHSLGEDFLHTVEAYADYLRHLTPDGVLVITRWLTMPPRENVRTILTAAEALRKVSPRTADDGLFIVRSWATATVVAKPSGFADEDVAALTRWAQQRGFDVDWYNGLERPTAQFHLMDEPVLFEAASAGTAAGDAAAVFASAYPFDVRPVTDARPFPHHFIRPSSIVSFLQSSRGTWLPFAEWGYVALLATLVQSAVLAAALTLLPAWIGTRRARAAFSFPLAGYFGAIGLAYLSAEIAAIQQLGLLLGHPVYAVAAVLAVFLVCSGLGSMWSDRIDPRHAPLVLGAVALLLLLYAVVLLRLVHLFQPFPLTVRVLAGVIEVAPVAFLMGLPFPLGLRSLAGDDTPRVAWAWATNGFASAVAAPLAALVALEIGSPAVLLVGAASYGTAAWIHHGGGSPVQDPLQGVD
jgi:spermidine synthase